MKNDNILGNGFWFGQDVIILYFQMLSFLLPKMLSFLLLSFFTERNVFIFLDYPSIFIYTMCALQLLGSRLNSSKLCLTAQQKRKCNSTTILMRPSIYSQIIIILNFQMSSFLLLKMLSFLLLSFFTARNVIIFLVHVVSFRQSMDIIIFQCTGCYHFLYFQMLSFLLPKMLSFFMVEFVTSFVGRCKFLKSFFKVYGANSDSLFKYRSGSI